MSHIPRLKKRQDFLRVAHCQQKVVTPTMIVQLAQHPSLDKEGRVLPPLRVGFTTSRKVGNAIKRNFARRRLRAIVEQVCPSFVFAREDIVLIARPSTGTAGFSDLLRDFHHALNRLGFSSL